MEHTFYYALAASAIAVVIGSVFVYASYSKKSGSDGSGDGKGSPGNPDKKKKKQKESFPAGKMKIYFGSQTGTAEGFARTLMEDGRKVGFEASIVDLCDFDAEEMKETPLCIYLMATYGEGEPTDNAAQFYQWIRNDDKEKEGDCLAGKCAVSVFGLGNKQYAHYNRMGKQTDKLLIALGAARAFDYGEGDDDDALEEDFDRWRAELWPALLRQFHPDGAKSEAAGSEEVYSKIELQFGVSGKETVKIGEKKVNMSTEHFYSAPSASILVNRELRNANGAGVGEVGSTRHIEIDLKGTGLQYCTADNLAILPENCTSAVDSFAAAMGYKLGDTITLNPVDAATFKFPFPTPCTVQQVLSGYVDLQGPLRHTTLKRLVAYVTDASQRAWLVSLLRKENRHGSYKTQIEEQRRSLANLLCADGELSSCVLPMADLLHIAPFITARYYTISSSSSVHPHTVHITVSITDYDCSSSNGSKIAARRFTGLTSGFVRDLQPSGQNSKCRVFVRASSFRLPKNLAKPIVMIGPGTGIAPMRALLQERQFHKGAGENVLYFGCRHKARDFIYEDELTAFKNSGVITALHLAFSRDAKPKAYVQNVMAQKENAAQLFDLVDAKGGYVYVCGATAMGHDVLAAFQAIVKERKGLSESAAEKYVMDMQNAGRYVQELWSSD